MLAHSVLLYLWPAALGQGLLIHVGWMPVQIEQLTGYFLPPREPPHDWARDLDVYAFFVGPLESPSILL